MPQGNLAAFSYKNVDLNLIDALRVFTELVTGQRSYDWGSLGALTYLLSFFETVPKTPPERPVMLALAKLAAIVQKPGWEADKGDLARAVAAKNLVDRYFKAELRAVVSLDASTPAQESMTLKDAAERGKAMGPALANSLPKLSAADPRGDYIAADEVLLEGDPDLPADGYFRPPPRVDAPPVAGGAAPADPPPLATEDGTLYFDEPMDIDVD